MKTLMSCLLIILITLTTGASTVLWDIVSKEESSGQEFWVVRNESRPYFWSIFDFDVTVSGNTATLTSNPRGDRILSFSGAWLIACFGDIVSSATTLNASSYFEYGLLGNGEACEAPISIGVGEVNYLKIVLQDGEQCFDYQDGTRTAMPDCYYGWVAYSVDGNGVVTVLSSALDVTGESIVVGGAVPEPSSALLFLLGCAGLLLKRRQCKFLVVNGCGSGTSVTAAKSMLQLLMDRLTQNAGLSTNDYRLIEVRWQEESCR